MEIVELLLPSHGLQAVRSREVLEPSTVSGYYIPLAMTSLMVDNALGGRPNDLYAYHRTALILHVLNTGLVVLLLHLLFGRPWPAAVAGLLFGLHPLNVEAVAWVGPRRPDCTRKRSA